MTAALRRLALSAYVPARTARWPEASRLFVVGDDFGWSIDDDRDRLSAAAHRLGYDVAPAAWAQHAERQAVFHHDHFGALRSRWLESSHRLGLSYFHGRPGTPGYPEFDSAYEMLKRHTHRIDRVQVTHAEMHALVVAAGVDPENVHRIPIGVDLNNFPLVDPSGRARARSQLGIPDSAFVIGSFVKDGVGLGDGSEPKLVKGPDTLVEVLARLHEEIPGLVVLLTGPARGYVRRVLESRGVALRHALLETRADLGRAYHTLDVTLVASRQEGGPKAVLESLAAGVPLVTTRVGQASELLTDGEDGLLADVDDVDALTAAVLRIHADAALTGRLRAAGRLTAEANADERLDGRWAALLDGFVQKGSSRVD
jgi:glycosyltransferase involved in cell wall biosynthesis